MACSTAALDGIRILDLTQYLSGPFATLMMGDLGADVIKIENPNRTLGGGAFINGERVYDLSTNRSKRSVVMDLKDPVYKELFLKMAAKADIIIENFKPGTMEKLGLSYDEVIKVNPRIIYTSISGFGQTGPYREKGALDLVIQAMSGFMSITGEANGRPIKAGSSIADIVSGFYAVIGTLTALHHRDVSGKGQYVDIAMLDSMFSILENAVVNYFATGKVPGRLGNRHSVAVPFQSFETSEGEMVVTVNRDPLFKKFCQAIHREELCSDERFITAPNRTVNVDALDEEITKTTKTKTMAELERDLEAADIPCGRINTIDQIVQDPQIQARDMIVEVEHPRAGKFKMVGSPLKMSETPAVINRPAPMLGQHTLEVFRELLGMDEEDIKALKNKK